MQGKYTNIKDFEKELLDYLNQGHTLRETGEKYGDKWLVLNGLHNGDRLIVEGSAKVTSGQTVKAVEVQADGGNA